MAEETFIEFHPESWEQVKAFVSRFSNWIYRGQSKAAYQLETTINRAARIHGISPDEIEDYESTILNRFRRQAHHFLSVSPHTSEVIEWLAIVQHHGGPTRLLDFTHSFYIACFFALEAAEDDCAVWCLNPEKLKQCVRSQHPEIGDKLTGRTPADLSFFQLPLRRDLCELMALPVEPFQMNVRLAIQQGLFVLPFNIRETFESNLFSTLANSIEPREVSVTDYERAHIGLGTFPAVGRLLKILLKKPLHGDIRQDLARMNISSATLFPGLDGFARSLAAWTR